MRSSAKHCSHLFAGLCLLVLSSNAGYCQFKTAALQVDGLTCSLCSYSVQRSVQKLDFVQKIDVDLNTNVTAVDFKNAQKVDIRKLINSVYNAGFSVRQLSALFDFSNTTISGNSFKADDATFFIVNTIVKKLSGDQRMTFVDKKFTDKETFKKYKQTIDELAAKNSGNGPLYFVTL